MRHAAAIRTRARSVLFALASFVLLLNATHMTSAEASSAKSKSSSQVDVARKPVPTTLRRLSVTAVTDSSISIAWSGRRGGVVGYRVYLDGVLLVDSTSDNAYTFTGLSCATSYVLGVAAVDAASNQSPTATVTARTTACPPNRDSEPPTMPGNLHAAATTNNSITIVWTQAIDNVGVVGYGVYNGVKQVDSTSATSYTFSNLSCATGYTLAVDAYDAAGNRSVTAILDAKTGACSTTEPPAIAGQGYRLTFADEFDTLERPIWDDHIWYDDAPLPTWAPTQFVTGGVLHLVSRRGDLYPGCTSVCYPISTATTYSSGKSFQYGYFEARMTWTKGAGSWPAFWLLSTGWARTGSCSTPAGELDVMEGQGTEPNVFYGTIHRDSAGRCGG